MLAVRGFRRYILAVLLAIVITTFYFSPSFEELRGEATSLYRPAKEAPVNHDVASTENSTALAWRPAPVPSKTLVVASTAEEDTSWIITNFDDEIASKSLKLAIYNVDDRNAYYAVPMNKGHESMVYLTYIIDHYDNLSDVTLFMHSHQITWHNNDLLLSDSVSTIKMLRSERVLRHGYMNLRCHHDPGCPAHIKLGTTENDVNIPEAVIMKDTWTEIFPNISIPEVLSQPCCAQFAVSADRIRTIPLEQYMYYRGWLMRTGLDDRLSGRVFEYLWQFLFAGVEEYCPEEHVCYCDGYGMCMGGKAEFDDWFETRQKLRNVEAKLSGTLADDSQVELMGDWSIEKQKEMKEKAKETRAELEQRRKAAIERGSQETERQKELGEQHSR